MTLGEDLERRARAAGLWCDGGPAHDGSRIGWMLCIEDGRARVWNRIPGVPVVPTWLAIPEALLLVQLAALPPRVRRCPACEGSKVQEREVAAEDWLEGNWTWTGGTLPIDGASPTRIYQRPCPTCSEPGEPVECGACEGKGEVPLPSRRNPGPRTTILAASNPGWSAHIAVGPDGVSTRTGWRPCDDCRGSRTQPGPRVPAGRVSTGWHEVWLGAMPKPGEVESWDEDHGEHGMEPMVSWYPGLGSCPGTRARGGPETGDPEAIAELTARVDIATKLAHMEPRLEVWLDHRIELGEPWTPELRDETAEAVTLAPLSQALALWLAGALCGECEGRGEVTYYEPAGGGFSTPEDADCDSCEGHGTALAQHLAAHRAQAHG